MILKAHIRRFLNRLSLLPILLGSACAINPATGKQNLVLLSEQQEIELGREAHQDILTQYGSYDNSELQSYINKIGKKIAKKSHRNDLIYRFTVLDSKEVNAFALPGGYIYITRGLLAYLNSEAQLAAVLGHEIAHVTARHSVRQYTAGQLANMGIILSSLFVPTLNNQLSNQLLQVLGVSLLRGYGREHELEADRLGAEYLARSNYAPSNMLEVIRILKNQQLFNASVAKAEGREQQSYHGLFATHPDNDTRLKEVIAHARQPQHGAQAGRDLYLDMIDGLVFGDSPQQGIVRGSNFYHLKLGFSFQFPDTWSIKNWPNMLELTAPGGKATLYLFTQDLNKRIGPRDFMRQVLNLKQLSDERALTIHQLQAHTGVSSAKPPPNFSDRLRFTVIYFNDKAYILVGAIRKLATASHYDDFFIDTAKSFHPITAKEKTLAKPLRLKIVASDKENFTDLLGRSPLGRYAEEQLRLLNNIYPTGRPKKRLKIVE